MACYYLKQNSKYLKPAQLTKLKTFVLKLYEHIRSKIMTQPWDFLYTGMKLNAAYFLLLNKKFLDVIPTMIKLIINSQRPEGFWTLLDNLKEVNRDADFEITIGQQFSVVKYYNTILALEVLHEWKKQKYPG